MTICDVVFEDCGDLSQFVKLLDDDNVVILSRVDERNADSRVSFHTITITGDSR
jgi:hypothetical protein